MKSSYQNYRDAEMLFAPSVLHALIVTMLFVFQSQTVSAQDYFYNKDYYDVDLLYEAGASFGVMNCLTDLGGHKGSGKPFLKDFNFGNTQIPSFPSSVTVRLSLGNAASNFGSNAT